MAQYLSDTLPPYRFQVIPLQFDDIDMVIKEKRIEFIITQPASYANLEYRYGITRIATMRKRRNDKTYTHFGAVIFTRSDRNDIHTLEDLRNKSFMAVHPDAFGGWWMAWREFERAGFNVKTDFSTLMFSGLPQDRVVFSVNDGDVDAGTVRTGVLESLAQAGKIDLADFRILNQRKLADFPQALSTELYPEWPLAAAAHTPADLAQRVVVALLRLPEDHPAAAAANISGWTVPVDYHAVHELMRELNVGVYAESLNIDVSRFVARYQSWIWGTLAALTLALAVAGILMQIALKLKHSQSQLKKEILVRQQAVASHEAQGRRLRMLYDASSMPGLTFHEQLREVLRLGCRLLDMQVGSICRIDLHTNSSNVVEIVAPQDESLSSGVQVSLNAALDFIAYVSEKPLVVNAFSKSEWRHQCENMAGRFESFLAATVWVNGQKFGTISFASPAARAVPFEGIDVDLVKLIGRWAGMTLERQMDREETERARASAEQANAAKSDFLSKMSHELRTPLNAIIGYSEMIYEVAREENMNGILPDLPKITTSATLLLTIINDILDLAKVESGKIELFIEEFSIAELVREVAATMRPLVDQNHNRLVIDCPADVGSMHGDVVRTRQILFNLLSNAVKFTKNGIITVSARKERSQGVARVVLAVSDTGIGIKADKLAVLFADFVQAERSTTRKFGGTGLGLAICKKFANLLGGDISVVSQLDRGSTFRVWFPLHCTATQPAKTSSPAPATSVTTS